MVAASVKTLEEDDGLRKVLSSGSSNRSRRSDGRQGSLNLKAV